MNGVVTGVTKRMMREVHCDCYKILERYGFKCPGKYTPSKKTCS